MNTTDERHEFWTLALKGGAASGVILIIYLTIMHMTGDNTLPILGIVPYLILSYGIHYCQSTLRRRREDSTYGRLLLIGLICGVAASLLVDLYSLIYIKVLNPGYVDQMMEVMGAMRLSEYGYSEQQMRSMIGPSMPISITLMYTVVTLLLSAFSALLINMKKTK